MLWVYVMTVEKTYPEVLAIAFFSVDVLWNLNLLVEAVQLSPVSWNGLKHTFTSDRKEFFTPILSRKILLLALAEFGLDKSLLFCEIDHIKVAVAGVQLEDVLLKVWYPKRHIETIFLAKWLAVIVEKVVDLDWLLKI